MSEPRFPVDANDAAGWMARAMLAEAEVKRERAARRAVDEALQDAIHDRDDYKERWEILGRVAKKVIDRLRAENDRLRAGS